MNKRLASAFLALALAMLTAMPALALRRICISDYQDDELCTRYCVFYDASGEFAGSIYEDYGC